MNWAFDALMNLCDNGIVNMPDNAFTLRRNMKYLGVVVLPGDTGGAQGCGRGGVESHTAFIEKAANQEGWEHESIQNLS